MSGKPITHYAGAGYDTALKIQICNMAIHGMLKMVFSDNYIHADLVGY
jgi:hypothetical protein